jgi:hypothetical protein
MEQERDQTLLPAWIQRAIMLICTLAALGLYGGVLGTALVRTLQTAQPEFGDNMVRAAGLLSGLVGAVVTAGFARSQSLVTVQGSADDTGLAARKRRRSRKLQSKLASLASTLGLAPAEAEPLRAPEAVPDAPAESRRLSAIEWIALSYFVVYFAVGVVAFVVTITRTIVPDLIANSAWVWLGTAITSAYSYLGLNLRD